MTERWFVARRVAGLKLMLVAVISLACADSVKSDAVLTGRLAKAERILVATPEKDSDALPGEQFRVEINEVLKGTGDKGKLAVITNSGEKDRHPRYKAGQRYVFLLTKNPAGKGWLNSGDSEIPLEKDTVRFLDGGKVKDEVSLADFQKLIARGEEFSSRETLAGRWTLVMSRDGNDFHGWLLEIAKDEKGAYQAKLLESSKDMMKSAALTDFEITDDRARLTLLVLSDEDSAPEESKFIFRGKLENGRVRGSVALGDSGAISPARLIATESDALRKFSAPIPSEGRQEFLAAVEQENEAFEPLLKFVAKYPDSPLAIEAYQMLISSAPGQKYDKAKYQSLGNDYLKAAAAWSPYLELRAYLQLGMTLSRNNYLTDLALEYLDTAQKSWIADAPSYWLRLIRIERSMRLRLNGKIEESQALLADLHKDFPFEEQISFSLAQAAEERGELDTAIELYAEIVGLPMMESQLMEVLSKSQQNLSRERLPKPSLVRVWHAKHGNLNGLPEYLDGLYGKKVEAIAGPQQPARGKNEGNRVVLCELFTGSSCPPCIGADVALHALETAYRKSEVIVLRYHQHSPAPDPLANEDSMARFESFPIRGTPNLAINGKVFNGPGGFMAQVPDRYQRIRETVDPYLTERIGLRFELSTASKDGKVAISAKALGMDEFPDDVRLHLVLAEDDVAYAADNGIRHHQMVVRSLIAGPEGLEPKQGRLEFEGDVDLAKLKADLDRHLATIEAKIGSPFNERPLDLGALHLVAFLQNDDDEVLQAAAVPVTGPPNVANHPKRPVPRTARLKAPASVK